jgi:hypothetical protein
MAADRADCRRKGVFDNRSLGYLRFIRLKNHFIWENFAGKCCPQRGVFQSARAGRTMADVVPEGRAWA